MLQRNYNDSLIRLGLLNSTEAEQIFGGIMTLLPVHVQLKEELSKAKGCDGSIDSVAEILLKWVRPRFLDSSCVSHANAGT